MLDTVNQSDALVATGDGGYQFHRDHRCPGTRAVARGRFFALPVHRRRLAIEALHWIAASPQPDGITKREAPPFPRRGVIEAIYDNFVIIYMIDADGVLFLRVQERTDLSIEE
jgi:hypothetical protein